ncbi:MAG: sarcosine oxidase subunit gamma family protein [Pseudomonadota bacterium]
MSEPVVSRASARDMITLRVDLATASAALREVIGLDVPQQRRVTFGQGRLLAWMAHDELLLVIGDGQAPNVVAALSAALDGQHHLVADVSDARALFQISGPGAREVLAKGAPVDLDPVAFGPGDVRRTRLAQVAAAFWMTQDGVFELVCFRSVAEYVETVLSTAANPDSLPAYFPA